MRHTIRVLCVLIVLLALLGPPSAIANHEGGGVPGQGPAPSGQGGAAPAPTGTQQDSDNGSTLASVGTMVGLLLLSGAIIAIRARRRGPASPPP